MRALAGQPGVEVTGPVPDVGPLFRAAAVYAAPLRVGGGVRLKILEAFAHGAPVVSTRLGAEGIALTDGRDALLADDAAAFAGAVVALLADRARRPRDRRRPAARWSRRATTGRRSRRRSRALYAELLPTARGAVARAV